MELGTEKPNLPKAIFHPKAMITAGFSLAFYCLVRAMEGVKYAPFPTQPMLPQTVFLICSFGSIAAMWWLHGRSWSYYFLMHCFALGFGTATLAMWAPYEYAIGGVSGDAWFSTAMVTKFKNHWGNTDFAYKGLHAFYPSLYQYVVGKCAWLTGTPVSKAMKYGGYWTAYLLPLAAYGMWRKFLAELPAFLLVVSAMAICRIHLTFKPFEVMAANIFLPWALYYVAGLRLREAEGRWVWDTAVLTRREIIVGGWIGGLCFMAFYYYFFLFIFWIPIQILLEHREGGSHPALLKRLHGALLLAGTTMLVSAIYWLPLVTDMIRFGFQSFQNRWFQLHMITLPFDISTHWRWMVGLVVLIGMAPQNRLARVILGIFAALIGYQILGHIGMFWLFPLLHVRMIGLEEYLLALGFVLGVTELFRVFRGYLHSAFEKLFPVAFMTVVCFGMGIGFMWEKFNDGTKEAANTVVPPLIVFPEFNAMCHDQVFLTNRYELAAYRPMFLFLCQNAHYSHPASRYRERVKFLVLLCKSRDSDFVSWMLQYNRYDRVDHVLLDDNKIVISDDNFPHQQNHIFLDATFEPGIFDGQYFEQDSLFPEIQHTRPMPADSWKKFSPEQLRLAALFSDQDREEIRAMVPAMVMKAMEEELHLRTTDYPLWQRSFWDRFMGGFGHQDAELRRIEYHQRKLAFERILKLPAAQWADRLPEDAVIYYKASDSAMVRWMEQWNGRKGTKKRLRFFGSIEALRSSGTRYFWFSMLDLPEMRDSEAIRVDDSLLAGLPPLGDFLRSHSQYEIIIAGKDECASAPSQATRSYFREIRSSFDSLKFRESYVLHLNQGKVIYERHDRGRITYDSPGKKPVRVRSGGLFAGNVASISVDGREMALNGRGLNVVVLDQSRNVVASAVFDTFADDREHPLFVRGSFLPPK